MPSTYSVNTGFEIIATGEKSGTWGDITNGNLRIIDAALNGASTVNLTGEGSAYTLDTSNWLLGGTTPSPGQNKLIIFTGGDNPSPASRITINITGDATGTPRTDLQKIYMVRASGVNYGLEISTGNGATKVNLDDNDFKIIYADGSNDVIDLTNEIASGSIKITGGSIDGTPIGGTTPSTGAFTSADIDAGTIDNTVIGGTTPNAATFSALTVSGAGTTFTVAPATTGSLNNITIGASTAAAGNFTNIDATGTLAVDGNVTLGDASSDTVTINSKIASHLLPSTTGKNLGGNSDKWNDLFVDGVAYVDDIHAADCDIDGGAIDGVVIGANSAAAATFTTATVTTLNATTVNAGNFYENQTSPTISSSTFTLDASTASLFYCTHAVGTDVTFDFTNVPSSGSVFTATIIHNYTGTSARTGVSIFKNNGASATVLWPSGSQPSEPGAGERDVLTLFTYDGGSTWYGGLSGHNMS